MEEMNQAINAATTPAVQMWMNWMLLIFALSLLFVWKYPVARVALVTFILTGFIGFGIFKLTGNPHLLGISHLLLWAPLAVYLYLKVFKSETFKLISPFGIWTALLFATIVISLLFDVRDVVLVLLGGK